jgi:hypothetical protein
MQQGKEEKTQQIFASNENKMSCRERRRAWLGLTGCTHPKLDSAAARGQLHRMVRCLGIIPNSDAIQW